MLKFRLVASIKPGHEVVIANAEHIGLFGRSRNILTHKSEHML